MRRVLKIDSYDAAEDNELSFKEGDKITEIEAASDEWWQGKVIPSATREG